MTFDPIGTPPIEHLVAAVAEGRKAGLLPELDQLARLKAERIMAEFPGLEPTTLAAVVLRIASMLAYDVTELGLESASGAVNLLSLAGEELYRRQPHDV